VEGIQGRVALRGCPALNRFRSIAGVAQLVEHQLPKLRVAGSNPVARFDESLRQQRCLGLLAWWMDQIEPQVRTERAEPPPP
jgi:hypothetical protein